MKAIGGFFELELPRHGTAVHPDAYALNTGRACLMIMLTHLAPKRVHVPFYTCDAALHPFSRLGIETKSYGLDEALFPNDTLEVGDGEYILWTNYFGVCGTHTAKLKERFGKRLLLDDTHAFFQNGHDGYWSFTSARKYFGVPDGAYLYAPVELDMPTERFSGVSLTHAVLRKLGRQSEAYKAYRAYESSLDCSVYRISEISEGLLRSVDVPAVIEARRRNFTYLHSMLGKYNQLPLGEVTDVPFCYPYLPPKPVDRQYLYNNGIFVPTLWPDIGERNISGYAFEKMLGASLLPLPIDHRYTPNDMQRMVKYVIGDI